MVPNETRRIALTGGAGSGKSTVARVLQDLGITVIDTDQIAREVVEPGHTGLEALIDAFGREILDSQERLDRRALRSKMLADADAKSTLESILHPRIMQTLTQQLAEAEGPYAVAEIPLLVEAGQADVFDEVITVEAPLEARLKRLMARDDIDESDAQQLIDAQASEQDRRAIAHHVLENDGSVADLESATQALHKQLSRR